MSAEEAAKTQQEAELSSSDSEQEWSAPTRSEAPKEPTVKEVDVSQLEGDEKELAGDQVVIQLNLPDGKSVQRKYVMGQTISYIKGHLEDLFQLPYHQTTLKMNGKLLLDPLSLNDLPFQVGSVNVVDVLLAQ